LFRHIRRCSSFLNQKVPGIQISVETCWVPAFIGMAKKNLNSEGVTFPTTDIIFFNLKHGLNNSGGNYEHGSSKRHDGCA
jgi:hypothetical protein